MPCWGQQLGAGMCSFHERGTSLELAESTQDAGPIVQKETEITKNTQVIWEECGEMGASTFNEGRDRDVPMNSKVGCWWPCHRCERPSGRWGGEGLPNGMASRLRCPFSMARRGTITAVYRCRQDRPHPSAVMGVTCHSGGSPH